MTSDSDIDVLLHYAKSLYTSEINIDKTNAVLLYEIADYVDDKTVASKVYNFVEENVETVFDDGRLFDFWMFDTVFKKFLVDYVAQKESKNDSNWIQNIGKLGREQFLAFEETVKNVINRGTIAEAKARWLASHNSKEDLETIAFESNFNEVSDTGKWLVVGQS